MSGRITTVSKPPKLERKKRVAAYARVSSGKDAMLHSLSAQVSHYSDLMVLSVRFHRRITAEK